MDYFSTLEEEPRGVVIATYLDNNIMFSQSKKYREGL
jgi:hypothetical protein